MQMSKIAFVAVALVIALVVVIGLAKTRNRAGDKNDVQPSSTVDTTNTIVDKPASESEPAPKASPENAAISAAAKQNRYVFVTFYRKDDGASKKMQTAMKTAQGKLSHRASFVSVDVDDPVVQEVVSRYGADRSPIPLTLVVAPNGAITASYPNEIKNADFSNAFVSSGMAGVIKAMQGQKLAVVCVQSPRTRHNKESLAAARKLASAQEFAGATQLVQINSADRGEAKLLKQLQVNASSPEAQVVVVAPPGKVAGKFIGVVPTETMVATVTQACGPGGSCGPSG